MAKFYVLPRGNNTMVKEASFFESQGGLVQPWGKDWEPITADGIEHARKLGSHLPTIDPMWTPVPKEPEHG